MSITIKNASLLLGRDLTFVQRGYIEVDSTGIITKSGSGIYPSSNNMNRDKQGIDAEGFLVIPGFINAHTHIGDSIGKDILSNFGLDKRVDPIAGVKKVILQKSKPEHLKAFMRSSAISMMKNGITAFADFREGGTCGVQLLKDAICNLPIKCIILGRVEYYFNNINRMTRTIRTKRQQQELKKTRKDMNALPTIAIQIAEEILKVSDGLGLSGANENTDESLRQYYKLIRKTNKIKNSNKRRKLLLAIHAAETKQTVMLSKMKTGKTEIQRIVQCFRKPDFIIHLTNASDRDISLVARRNTAVVLCPRANGVLGAGFPNVVNMLKKGCIIGLGTDNIMLNSPDMFREMDYLFKVTRAIEGDDDKLINAKTVLKMATTNGSEILGLNSGYIGPGRWADLIFLDKSHIDLCPMHDPHASIVHRATQSSIRAVMINGKFIDEPGL
jgi:cytosine/adenosine deaminase-related metal-dependent hydrolase